MRTSLYLGLPARSFTYLAVKDESGESLSTVELVLVKDQFKDMAPVVVQHRGANNSEPDMLCTRALSTAIHRLLAPDMQTWFRKITEIHSSRTGDAAGYQEHMDSKVSVAAIGEVMPQLEFVDDCLER